MVYYDMARHLVADSRIELRRFMEQLGIKAHWLHHWRGRNPHCDIPKRKMPVVVEQALLTSSQELLRISKEMK